MRHANGDARGRKSFVFSVEYSAFPVQSSLHVKTSKLLLVALICLVSLPVFAQLNDTYVVTAAANLSGGNNTRWLTQLSIFNPHLDYALNVSVTLLLPDGSEGPEKLIRVPANSTFITDDVMTDVFNRTGSGALLLATFREDNPGVEDTIVARAFLVSSNTYNNATDGTYGQTIPGVWAGLLDVDTDGITSVAHGIDNSTRLKFRTNIGAVNLGACDVTVRVSVFDADGKVLLNEAPFIVAGYGTVLDRLPVTVEGGSVEFLVEDPCANDDNRYAVVFPYTSSVDDLSGDPRYQTPVLLATANVLYGKKAVDPTTLGTKITSEHARKVRDNARREGTVSLTRSERGWVVEK
jgi:hypothetical protein